MKSLLLALCIISLCACVGSSLLLLLSLLYNRKYQAQAKKNMEQYAEEAKLLDDMAGLLEGLFDLEQPAQRRICARCEQLKECLCSSRMPDTPTVCADFLPRGSERKEQKQTQAPPAEHKID